MISQLVVPDSSVIVKWFAQDEADSSPALQLLQKFKEGTVQLIVPDLLFYEIGNVFLKKWGDAPEKREPTFCHLWRLPWLLMPLRLSLLTRTHEVANHFRITFYDALFVATAEKAHATFITSDQKLLNKIEVVSFAKSLNTLEG